MTLWPLMALMRYHCVPDRVVPPHVTVQCGPVTPVATVTFVFVATTTFEDEEVVAKV